MNFVKAYVLLMAALLLAAVLSTHAAEHALRGGSHRELCTAWKCIPCYHNGTCGPCCWKFFDQYEGK